jgi:hypothetical protein
MKYIKVAKYCYDQHPLMCTVFALGIIAIALMFYAADKDQK